MSIAVPRRVLPVIVLSQFTGTSLRFAVNAVMPDLERDWQLPAGAVGILTSAVQLGFAAEARELRIGRRRALSAPPAPAPASAPPPGPRRCPASGG